MAQKLRTVIKELPEEVHELLLEQSLRFFELTDELEVLIPSWTDIVMILIREKRPTLEFLCFEDYRDFFLYYAQRVSDTGDTFSCFEFISENETWKDFVPPTLIGPHLKTKFRK